jgi:RNA polymerase sigma factor (sigma-70 family)
VTTNRLTLVLEDLRRSTLLKEGAEKTDGQLLEAYLQGRDGLALEALVRRHAPMVWGVCRRILTHHDAEDAFQATFLVLVRKATSIGDRELLPNWLYRVACQTARKARQMAVKRRSREKQVSLMPEPPMEPHDGAFGPELRDVLDEEMSRLPEKYRIVVVLCDVEGKTRHDAAGQLGLPAGTVASRLARGRVLLARRLLKRGLTVAATALAAGAFHQAASGAVRATLLSQTVQAVHLVPAGEAVAAGLVSTRVWGIAQGVLRAMSVAKMKTAGALLVLASFAFAAGMAAYHTMTPPLPPSSPTAADRGSQLDPADIAPSEVRRFPPVEEWAWNLSYSRDGRLVNLALGVAISPDDKFIAVGYGNQQPIQLLDATTKKVCCELPAIGGRSVAFSPDSRLIACIHADGRLRLWDVAQGRLLHDFPGENGAFHSAAFTPDGKHVLVIDPGTALRLYEVLSGKEMRSFEGPTTRVTDVAISADGRHALSCSFDRTLCLWDLQTAKLLHRLVGHDEGVHGVAFCPDGHRALSCSFDGTVRLWDLRTGRQLNLYRQGVVCCVVISPDGRRAFSGSPDRKMHMWRLPDPAPAPGQ